MKKREMLDLFSGIDDKFIDEAAPERKTKTGFYRLTDLVACILIVALAIVPMSLYYFIDNINPSADTPSDSIPSVKGEVWTDDREKKGQLWNTDIGYVWRWEYLEDYERYREIFFNGKEYISNRTPLTDLSVLGDTLGQGTAVGADDYDGTEYSTGCEIREIKGINNDYCIAVRIDGTDSYYSAYRNDSYLPETLGDFIKDLGTEKYFTLSEFTVYEDGESIGRYEITPDTAKKIWKIMKKYGKTESSHDYPFEQDGLCISFGISSQEFGVTKSDFTIHEHGFIRTNAMRWDSCSFSIGESAAKEIIDYILSNKGEPIPSVYSYRVSGIVTEIGDDYFKIDDSFRMKNPEEGIVFTIRIKDKRISRYFLCGHVVVGDIISVEYDGIVDTDTYTIDNPLDISPDCSYYEKNE